MNVKIMKLMNGDDVIADIKYGNDNIVILSGSAKIMMFPSEEGGMGLALMPWLPYSDDKEVEIKEKNILITVIPSSQILNEYNERFGSGLVVPDSDLIL
jgi:hypothetical protein